MSKKNLPVPAATDPAIIRNFDAHIDHGKSTRP